MKRRKITAKGAALGAVFTGAALLGGCMFTHQTVYGPPPDQSGVGQQESKVEAEEETTFDPADMPIEDVYGPPEDWIDEDEPPEEDGNAEMSEADAGADAE